eukprot:1061431-Pyramimonas_sp.AAC.1
MGSATSTPDPHAATHPCTETTRPSWTLDPGVGGSLGPGVGGPSPWTLDPGVGGSHSDFPCNLMMSSCATVGKPR